MWLAKYLDRNMHGATVNTDESVVFTFKGGMEVTEQLI